MAIVLANGQKRTALLWWSEVDALRRKGKIDSALMMEIATRERRPGLSGSEAFQLGLPMEAAVEE